MNRLGLATSHTWGPADEAFAEHLRHSLQRLEPDVLYRRRLRGAVLNRYVAMREGLVQPPSRRPEMGALGRGVLYASLAVALAAGTAGAAAAQSLPGDPLYPVKLQLEEVRLQLAPATVRADLMAQALDERLDELEALARAGRWTLVAELSGAVAQAEQRLDAVQGAPGQAAIEELSDHAAVLEVLIESAPAAAQNGLHQAIEAANSQASTGDAPSRTSPNASPSAGPPSAGGQPPSQSGPQTSRAPRPD